MPENTQAAGQGQAQQAPFGTSSSTGPTPNAGYKAAAFQRLGLLTNQLTELLPLLGATSEEGQAVMKAISTLAKLVPTGSSSPTADRNSIQQMAMKNEQNSALQKQMQAQPGQQGAGAPPSMPPARVAA